jgi:hypothetical protein
LWPKRLRIVGEVVAGRGEKTGKFFKILRRIQKPCSSMK